MGFHNISETLRDILPFEASASTLEDLVMQSSYIPFHGLGQSLFRPGDDPLGFYWLLSGEAELIVPGQGHLRVSKGDMAGLDNFLLKQKHSFEVITASHQLETLFIDRGLFERLFSHTDFSKIVDFQLLNLIDRYKGMVMPNPRPA